MLEESGQVTTSDKGNLQSILGQIIALQVRLIRVSAAYALSPMKMISLEKTGWSVRADDGCTRTVLTTVLLMMRERSVYVLYV